MFEFIEGCYNPHQNADRIAETGLCEAPLWSSMRFDLVARVTRSLLMAILCPFAAFGDQTDTRLDQLFAMLQSSENAVEQRETELAIWEIWYAVGRDDVDALMEAGGEAVRSGQLERAEEIFTRVTELAPEFSEGWNRRATVRYHRRDYAGSLNDIERTLVLEPRHFGAIWGKGMILGLQRDFPAAIQTFERLLEITPYSRDAKRRIELLKNEQKKNSV